MNVLVLPTNRPSRVKEFLNAWHPWPWDRILIVEDGPEASGTVNGDQILWHSWRDIDASLAQPDIISRRDSGIRAYGFWRAWVMGADYIFTLDDDCFPVGGDYVRQHLQNLEATPVWHSSVPHLRVRGLPYANAGTLRNVYVSMGLWVGHPDVDAIQLLAHPSPGGERRDPVLDRGLSSRLMPGEQYFPLCGMNLAFRREAACLMYFPPMGLNSPYSRFDDIWAGLVLQRICRHLRYGIVCGQPVVEHRRASDPFTNLVKEAPGIRTNENLWQIIDAVDLLGSDPLTCMREMGAALGGYRRGDEYVRRWGCAILEWCKLFDAGAAGSEL
jgi:hypothetical protein